MAYTEFYAQSGGSNLNAGSTTNNTALYTATNGGWNSGTFVYTPTTGTNPVSAGVAVGMWASVYLDAASVGVFIGKITTVVNATNGTITLSGSLQAGSVPATNAAGRTIKVGGAWLGPNAASWFPFSLASYGANKDVSTNTVRTNLKNDQTYPMTASTATFGSTMSIVQGFTSTAGDGGRATVDGSTSIAALVTDVGVAGMTFTDIIWKTSFASGSTVLFTTVRSAQFFRCVFTGARGYGLTMAASSNAVECEFYSCNIANTSGQGSVNSNSGGMTFLRCIFHDNAGGNNSGIVISSGPVILQNCIFDTNGLNGINITGGSNNGVYLIDNCDFYNNGGDGIKAVTTTNPIWIENCNLIKNTGAGINNTAPSFGFVFNCGYGSGTQANGSADTLTGLAQSGTVTYASGAIPWVDGPNGDFRINLPAANFSGRAAFTETASSYAGTVGYPDIGAAQSLTGSGGTFSKEVSYGFNG